MFVWMYRFVWELSSSLAGGDGGGDQVENKDGVTAAASLTT